jgi:hypothetical protein
MLTKAIENMSGEELKTLLTGGGSPTKKSKSASVSEVQTFVVCFETNLNTSKPLLPITIEGNLPHIVMPIGQSPTTAIFSLLLAYNTCAACNVGYLGHRLPIVEKYQQLVKSLIWAADKYSPLVLSGIVSDEEGDKTIKPTATPPIIIKYWLPFQTKQGHRTSLKIALGKHVSVNTIIGMPFIQPAQLSLDLVDNVVNSGVLDTEPFPISFRPTSTSAPDFSRISDDDVKLLVSNSHWDHVLSENVRACITGLVLNGLS